VIGIYFPVLLDARVIEGWVKGEGEMKFSGRTAALGLTLSLAVILSACNMPATGGGPTPLPVAATSTTLPEPTVEATSTASAPEPTTAATMPPQPAVTPIAHLTPGSDFDLTWVSMISTNLGWGIGGISGGADHILRTQDGGLTWRDVTPPQAADVGLAQAASAFFLDSQIGWVLFHPQEMLSGGSMPLIVWRTQDGGSSWNSSLPLALDLSGATAALPDLVFTDSQTGWIMLHLGAAGMHRYPVYLLRSDDGGLDWQTLIDPYNAAYLQSCPKSGWTFIESTGLVSIGSCPIDSAAIDWSSDSGLTWTEVRLPFSSTYSSLAGNAGCEAHSPILRSTTSWVVAMDCRTFDNPPQDLHFLYQTTDEGASWSIGEYPGGALYFLDSQNGWAFGKAIYRTMDGGGSWSAISNVTWNGQFSVVDLQNIWAIANSGTQYALVRSTNGGSSWAIIDAQIVQ
jgi:photosystem II stability/assembly factor-like uncharacterized protein